VTRIGAAFLVVASAVTFVVAPAPPVHAAVRDPFVPPVFSTQDNGAILLVGNSQMTCPQTASGCTSARNAAPVSGTNNNPDIDNNSFTMAFIDGDGLAATTNSTSADVNLPAGSTVLNARLVWGGRRAGLPPTTTFGQVKIRAPGQTTYTTVTGTVFAPGLTGSTDADPYQASLDVTTFVRNGGNGTYWVGDIQAATGSDRYAGWSLVVAYRNPALPLRDLSVFEGFADVTTTPGNDTVSIPISGFLTPATGPVNASVGFVTWEGDRGRVGETVKLNTVTLTDAARPSNNFFDSSISDSGANVTARSPNSPNTFGVDVARVVANGVLPNNATSTTLVLSTDSEFYYPGIVTTQIDLFTPAFNPIIDAGVLHCRWLDIAVGATRAVTITATVNTGATSLTNSAAVSSASADPSLGDKTASVTTNVTAGADLGVSKTLTGGGTVAGGTATWTITVRSAGPATATGVVVVDTLPVPLRGATATPSTGTCVVAPAAGGGGGTARCELGPLAAGSQATVTVTGTVDPSFRGMLTNVAAASASNTDPDPTNNAASSSNAVTGALDLTIAKRVDRARAQIGQVVTFTVTATNLGPSDAVDAYVYETLPAGLTLITARPAVGTYNAGTARWSIGDLAAGISVGLELDVRLSAVGVQTNRAQIALVGLAGPAVAANGDTETRLDNNVATATVTVDPVPARPIPATGFTGWVFTRVAAVTLAAGLLLMLTARRGRFEPPS
jgi:uncharacterized repeat protein (TIGR01451 family)